MAEHISCRDGEGGRRGSSTQPEGKKSLHPTRSSVKYYMTLHAGMYAGNTVRGLWLCRRRLNWRASELLQTVLQNRSLTILRLFFLNLPTIKILVFFFKSITVQNKLDTHIKIHKEMLSATCQQWNIRVMCIKGHITLKRESRSLED